MTNVSTVDVHVSVLPNRLWFWWCTGSTSLLILTLPSWMGWVRDAT